jgi:serine/threonine protein phosphatase 1
MTTLHTDLPVICISDIHGCINTLIRLLGKIRVQSQIVFGGDLIDRGPNSRAVVELAMKHGIPTVMGNHESLALAFYNRDAKCAEMYAHGVWLDNGGDEAVRNWPIIDKRHLDSPTKRIERERDRHLGGRAPEDVLDWMEGLPPYLYPSNQLDENGRRLMVSHTGYGLNADHEEWFQTLWGRHRSGDGPFSRDPATGNERDDGLFRVFGHTPEKEVAITPSYAMIDTGAAYVKRGYGVLSAFVWPSKSVITQVYDETTVTQQFTISAGGILNPA